jgi:hypothetical protein
MLDEIDFKGATPSLGEHSPPRLMIGSGQRLPATISVLFSDPNDVGWPVPP